MDTKKETELLSLPHIGDLLTAHIREHRYHASAIARKLGKSDATVLKLRKTADPRVATLWALSQVLEHNFFADVAGMLPPHFTSNVPVDDSKDKRIAALERELEIVKAEREVLLRRG